MELETFKREFELKKKVGRLKFDHHVLDLQYRGLDREVREWYEEFTRFCLDKIEEV